MAWDHAENSNEYLYVRKDVSKYCIYAANLKQRVPLKVHKIENSFGTDFEYCIFSLLVMRTY